MVAGSYQSKGEMVKGSLCYVTKPPLMGAFALAPTKGELPTSGAPRRGPSRRVPEAKIPTTRPASGAPRDNTGPDATSSDAAASALTESKTTNGETHERTQTGTGPTPSGSSIFEATKKTLET